MLALAKATPNGEATNKLVPGRIKRLLKRLPLSQHAATFFRRRARASDGSWRTVPKSARASGDVFDLEVAAKSKLPGFASDFVEGGVENGRTTLANRIGYDKIQIRCRRLVDVALTDSSVRLFGHELPFPIILAPIGFQGVFSYDGERACARAAGSAGIPLIISTNSSYSVEKIAEVATGPLWFQLYLLKDFELTKALVRRAESAGCSVLVVTVDSPIGGFGATRSQFLAHVSRTSEKHFGNFDGKVEGNHADPSATWTVVERLKSVTSMKVVLKGIVTAEDALRCRETGVDGLIVSNHGGRQEPSGRSTIECLPEIVEAVGGEVPVLLDGGIRHGSDIFKSLGLGASAVCIGRPYVWGLAAFGQQGVERSIEILQSEFVRMMKFAGAPRIGEIHGGFLVGGRGESS